MTYLLTNIQNLFYVVSLIVPLLRGERLGEGDYKNPLLSPFKKGRRLVSFFFKGIKGVFTLPAFSAASLEASARRR
jgi:hypothetical protein